MHVYVETGMTEVRDELLRRLVDMLYERNDHDFHRGTFRVRGDVVEIFPQYEAERAIRVEFFGDEIESICEIDPLRGKVMSRPKRAMIYPASHYVATESASRRHRRHPRELAGALPHFRKRGQAARGAAPRAAHACTTSRCSRRWASVTASRTTRAGSTAAAPGRRPTRSTTTSPKTRSSCSTRATSRAADRRDVPRRPGAQGDARRVRLAAAVGARQPTAALRRVGGARQAAALRLGHAGGLRARASVGGRRRRADHPSHRADGSRRSRSARPAGQVDDLLGEIREMRRERASACWSRRSPSAWPRS